MAANISTALDVHSSTPYHFHQNSLHKNHHIHYTTPFIILPKNKKHFISCNSSSSKPPKKLKNTSLSDQLRPLSTTIIVEEPNNGANLLSKPRSIWVNPTKPKPSILLLQRQNRSSHAYNPQIKDLRNFARKLNECEFSEEAFLGVLDDAQIEISRDNALLVLNSLRSWERSLLFFNWIKTHELFELETIFYNVVMKSLRFGRQFEHIEKLANEMVEKSIDLDNITYSTIITCAKRCYLFDKAVEWFERMYKTGVMPDEVTYSAVLDVYAKVGKVEEVMSLYERGRSSGWKPDVVAFGVLGRMFGEAGDYDGIQYLLREMKELGVPPNLVVYNTLLEAMGKAGKPGLARGLFEEMMEAGIEPDAKTLTALTKIYGRARWGKDALQLWERMKSNNWPMDFKLYNTLLSMCADLGLEEEAERLFEDMKGSQNSRPDSWSFTSMLNIYGSGGNVEKAMRLFEEMMEKGVEVNVMGLTCLVQCLGRAQKIDDLVRVFEVTLERGVKPDDRLCGCLLSVVSYCEGEDVEKVLACLGKCDTKLVEFVKLLEQENTSFDIVKEEFKSILSNTAIEARRPFCNCMIDICRKRNLQERAHEILYVGTLFGLYPGLHSKTPEEWRLNVRSLSVGAALTAFEEWMGTLTKIVQREEPLPEVLSANTGAGTHRFAQGLVNAFASHVEKLAAPFRLSDTQAGIFVATREEVISWVESKVPSVAAST
ncbi:hypothetical protein Leryth_010551 [Lithospermum erythrorhizon]|nr:hypothetical protein Leryth_010551 [Lithospermum erythrorhizon]